MKRAWIILLLIAMLCGCTEQETWPGYRGTMEDYVYCFPEGRNREWEEDILYLAEASLNDHPYVMEADCWTYSYQEPFSAARTEYSREIFRPETRDVFLEQINLLIPRIAEWTDEKLAWEAKRLIAVLGDIHSSMNPVSSGEMVFPLGFVHIRQDEQEVLYAVQVPKTHEQSYLGKLVCINGIPVETIIERLTAYVSAENEHYPIYAITGFRLPGLLCSRNALHAVGIVEADAACAEFSFETETGIVVCTVDAVAAEEYGAQELLTHSMYATGCGLFREDENYWYTWLKEDVLYLRLASLREKEHQSFFSYIAEVSGQIQTAANPIRIILDFRYNTGGPPYESQWQYFVEAVNSSETDGVYLLINGSCISSGVAAPYQLSEAIPGVILVGSPTAQFPNSPAGQSKYIMPHTEFPFHLSGSYTMFAPGLTESALYPDISVYQTWEDYINCKDTVLEYVQNLS